MTSPIEPVADRALRRRSRLTFGLISTTATLVLLLTVVVQIEAPPSRSARLEWAVASLTISALLLTLLVTEVLRRARSERAVSRADSAMWQVAGGDVLDDRPLPRLLEDLASSVAKAMDAASATLHLDATSDEAPDAPREPTPTDDDAAAGIRLTVALVCENVRLGSMEVAAEPGEDFGDEDRLLLQLLAPRVAAYVLRARLGDAERRSRLAADHARRQVSVLARASVPLAPALENPEEAIAEIAEIVIPEYADLFAVDLLRDDGRLERIIAAYGDDHMAAAFAELSPQFSAWPETLRRVMDTDESELAFWQDREDESRPLDAHGALMRALGMQSWVVAAIRVRDTSLGTVTLATRRGRRGYRPSDQVTINDLVARSSIAFERGMLYQEARQAADDASRRADQLARMVAATTELTRILTPSMLLETLVEQAAYVLDAPYARAELVEPDLSEAEWGHHPDDAVRITSALVDHVGATVGNLTVERARTSPFASDAGAVLTMLAESASITNRNGVLYEDLRDREHRLQALIEASPLAILELDATGIVEVANPAARVLFPASAPDSTELVHLPAALVERLGELVSATARGERRDAELVTIDVGERRDLWVSTAPVPGDNVESGRMLAVITDMTERVQLEEQLASTQRFEAIATLAGGIAHDFNNLLTVILGYSEILLDDLPDPSPEHESVEAIQEAGSHAAVITNQLLALSRHQALQPETIDVGARCAALMPMLRRLAGADVTIDSHFERGARITVDPGQLEQVLFNLVFNSRDAMPHGGHLDIAAGPRVEPDGRDTVFVRVTDNGEGMDEETLARAEEPFFTTKGRSRGIGLGLATVASVMERSGGTLRMTSQLGKGTSSTMVFPRESASDRPALPEVPQGPGRRVLLVDDDDQVRHFTARVLAQGGHRVTEVADGESAIALIEAEGAFDLVVTDVVLPAMSGAAVVRTIRARWPAMACLLITGYAGPGSLDTDADDTMVVPKPFTPEDLLRGAARAVQAAARREAALGPGNHQRT